MLALVCNLDAQRAIVCRVCVALAAPLSGTHAPSLHGAWSSVAIGRRYEIENHIPYSRPSYLDSSKQF